MNIIFDIGMVLIQWDPRYLYRKMFTDETKMEWFLANVCHSAWNLEQDRGRSFAEAVKLITPHHPEYAAEIDAYDKRWAEMIQAQLKAALIFWKRCTRRAHRFMQLPIGTNTNSMKPK